MGLNVQGGDAELLDGSERSEKGYNNSEWGQIFGEGMRIFLLVQNVRRRDTTALIGAKFSGRGRGDSYLLRMFGEGIQQL